MDNDKNHGTIKTLKSKFVLNDMCVSNIIKGVLTENGYDLTVEPIIDKINNFFIGEEIKVYQKDNIR